MHDAEGFKANFNKMRQARAMLRQLALVAVLGVGLGLVIQIVIVVIRAFEERLMPGIGVVADLGQSVTWNALVCTGLAIGVSVGKGRKALAGILGLLFAPLALAMAKASQEAISVLLDAVAQPEGPSLVAIGVVRAIEYGLLAWLLAILTEKEVVRMGPYLRRGAGVGVGFGAVAAWLSYNAILATGAAPTIGKLLSLTVTEIAGPAGCAAVIYVGQLARSSAHVYNEHRLSPIPSGDKTAKVAPPISTL